MKGLNHWFLCCVSASLLVLGCSDKTSDTTKRVGSEMSDSFAYGPPPQMLKSSDFKLTSLKVNYEPSQAQQALAAMGFGPDGVFVWTSMERQKTRYVFENVTLRMPSDLPWKIGQLSLDRPFMENGKANTARVDIQKYTGWIGDSGKSIIIDELVLMSPKAITSQLLWSGLADRKDKLSFDIWRKGEVPLVPFSRLRIRGVQIENAIGLKMRFDSLNWAYMSDDQTANMLVDDFEIIGDEWQFGFENVSMAKLHWEKVWQKPREFKNSLMAFLPTAKYGEKLPFEHIRVGNYHFNGADMTIKGQGVWQRAGKGDMRTHIEEESVLLPLKLTFKFDGSENVPENLKLLQDLGYQSLIIQSGVKMYYDIGKGMVEVKDHFFDIKDAFQLNLTGLFTDISFDQTYSMEPLEKMSLTYLKLHLKDQSLRQRVLSYLAKQQGLSEGMIRTQAKGALALMALAAQNDQQKAILSQMQQPVSNFIDEGGTLMIDISPEEHWTIEEALSPDFDLSRLGIHFSVK